jgi:hypothetical protein
MKDTAQHVGLTKNLNSSKTGKKRKRKPTESNRDSVCTEINTEFELLPEALFNSAWFIANTSGTSVFPKVSQHAAKRRSAPARRIQYCTIQYCTQNSILHADANAQNSILHSKYYLKTVQCIDSEKSGTQELVREVVPKDDATNPQILPHLTPVERAILR